MLSVTLFSMGSYKEQDIRLRDIVSLWKVTKPIIKPLNQYEKSNLKTFSVSPLWYITALPFIGGGCFDSKLPNKGKAKAEVNTASKPETSEEGKDKALAQDASSIKTEPRSIVENKPAAKSSMKTFPTGILKNKLANNKLNTPSDRG